MDPKDILGIRDGNEGTYGKGVGKSAGEAGLNNSPDQLLIEKVKARRLVDAATRASEPAFTAVWDNDQDAAYDRL